MTSFYTREELESIGFRSLGEDVSISRKASIYSPALISIGNHVRIDDFCILSGNITLGDHIHIAAYTALYGSEAGISVGDFANLSSRVTVYAVSDDYSGDSLTNPTVPDEFKTLTSAPVVIGRHVIIGSTSVVLPGVTLGEGGSFGAFSFINRSCEEWTMYAGIPVKPIRPRSRKALELEKEFIAQEG